MQSPCKTHRLAAGLKKCLTALVLLAGCCVGMPVFAAQFKDPASGCTVAAPRYLGSDDYTFRYQGGCKAGLAEGKGKATWSLRNAPGKAVVWEGTFSAGVYLPPPAGIVSARAWIDPRGNSNDTVIFDMGALLAQSGVTAARLVVEATSSSTDYPDPCIPRTLWVTHVPTAALASDSAAQSLLAVAVDKLKARCGTQIGGTKKRPSGALGVDHLQVRVVSTPDLESDRYGNPGPALVSAAMPLSPSDAVQSYSNQVAAQQRQQQRQVQDQDERQANARRLRAFFQTYQATGWASLKDIEQNPFRYTGRVVVTAAQLDEVISPTRATLLTLSSDDYWWSFANAVLDGEGIAQWKPGARLLAVRVTGRLKENAKIFPGWPQLQLVGSQTCAESRCQDWLRLPTALRDGQMP